MAHCFLFECVEKCVRGTVLMTFGANPLSVIINTFVLMRLCGLFCFFPFHLDSCKRQSNQP